MSCLATTEIEAMSLPTELVKNITGFAFNATECERECQERCARMENTVNGLRAFIMFGMGRSLDSLHEALARERSAHAQTKRNTTRQINTLKRKLDQLTASLGADLNVQKRMIDQVTASLEAAG